MRQRPQQSEAAAYYFTYIDRIGSDDIVGVIERQLEEIPAFLAGISEEKSMHRYAPGKWSIRESWSHVNDCERVLVLRAFWFARGFDTALPSFDQNIAVAGAQADEISWARHIEEFRVVRLATLAFFRNLTAEGWARTGTASGNPFTVRALAYIAAGHVEHHRTILEERYL
jgi:hypothetical protein